MCIRRTRSRGRQRLSVAGTLVGADTKELGRACGELAGAYTVDLTEVTEVDDEGLRLLRSLRQHGARLIGTRPYLNMRLKQS